VEAANPKEGRYSYIAAARRIGVNVHSLKSQVREGVVQTVGSGVHTGLATSEVVRWRKYFSTLNVPFDCLPYAATNRTNRPATMTLSVAGRTLGVSTATIARWVDAGLLPYYPDSISPDEAKVKAFLAEYIKGLVKYACETPVRRATAERYRALCMARKKVV
jgi:hypothetical protein